MTDINGNTWHVSPYTVTTDYPDGVIEVRCGEKITRYCGITDFVAPEHVWRRVYENWRVGKMAQDVA